MRVSRGHSVDILSQIEEILHERHTQIRRRHRRVAGIGAGLVRGFLDRDYRIVANSRSIQPGASADVLTVAGDIADAAVADRVIGGAVERFGRVDTLVNNAGIFIAKQGLGIGPDVP